MPKLIGERADPPAFDPVAVILEASAPPMAANDGSAAWVPIGFDAFYDGEFNELDELPDELGMTYDVDTAKLTPTAEGGLWLAVAYFDYAAAPGAAGQVRFRGAQLMAPRLAIPADAAAGTEAYIAGLFIAGTALPVWIEQIRNDPGADVQILDYAAVNLVRLA